MRRFDALYVAFGDDGHVFGPAFPVAAVAYFFHHAGEDHALQLLELDGQLAADVGGGGLVGGAAGVGWTRSPLFGVFHMASPTRLSGRYRRGFDRGGVC
jgi:hypothetical protein